MPYLLSHRLPLTVRVYMYVCVCISVCVCAYVCICVHVWFVCTCTQDIYNNAFICEDQRLIYLSAFAFYWSFFFFLRKSLTKDGTH